MGLRSLTLGSLAKTTARMQAVAAIWYQHTQMVFPIDRGYDLSIA